MTAAQQLTTQSNEEARATSRAGRVSLLAASASAGVATIATAEMRSSESEVAILLLVAAAGVIGALAGYVLARRAWPTPAGARPVVAGSNRPVILVASLAFGLLAGLVLLLVGPILGAPPGTLIALAPLMGLAGGEFLLWVARGSPSGVFLAALAFVLGLLVLVAIAANLPNAPGLDVTASLSGTNLVIEGATDLPDGAELWVSAQVPNRDPEDAPTQKVQVAGRRYSATFDTRELPGDDFFASVIFMPIAQSEEIKLHYGALGENLRGPDVHEGSGDRYVMLTTVVSR